jgi:hypothetical protein
MYIILPITKLAKVCQKVVQRLYEEWYLLSDPVWLMDTFMGIFRDNLPSPDIFSSAGEKVFIMAKDVWKDTISEIATLCPLHRMDKCKLIFTEQTYDLSWDAEGQQETMPRDSSFMDLALLRGESLMEDDLEFEFSFDENMVI